MQTAQKDTQEEREFVEARDIAEVFSLHPESVRRMAREDRIDAVRIGGRWRFPARIIRDARKKNASPQEEAREEAGG